MSDCEIEIEARVRAKSSRAEQEQRQEQKRRQEEIYEQMQEQGTIAEANARVTQGNGTISRDGSKTKGTGPSKDKALEFNSLVRVMAGRRHAQNSADSRQQTADNGEPKIESRK
jgi:hypothetical protein